jgi:hypothetical protein
MHCLFTMTHNAPQYGVGGDFGTRYCPPLKRPERGLVAGCGTYHPAAPILLVVKSCYKYCLSFFSIISAFQLFFIKYNPPLSISVGCFVCVLLSYKSVRCLRVGHALYGLFLMFYLFVLLSFLVLVLDFLIF